MGLVICVMDGCWLVYLGSFVFVLVSLELVVLAGGVTGSQGLEDVCSCPDSCL